MIRRKSNFFPQPRPDTRPRAQVLGIVVTVVSLATTPLTLVAAHPWGLSPAAVTHGGALVIAGGGPLPEVVYDEFVRLAGGARARLVIIPSAHHFDSLDEARQAYRGWYSMGAQSVTVLHATDRDEAEAETFAAPLRGATGVWIGGGVQGRLADRYGGTPVVHELQRILDGGGVIGGTSAGASVMSQTMIREGTRTRAQIDRGFGLLPGTIIDQHFLARGREPRLIAALSDHPGLVGIGIDERTALVLRGDEVQVIGQSRVVIYPVGAAAHPDRVRSLGSDQIWKLAHLNLAAD